MKNNISFVISLILLLLALLVIKFVTQPYAPENVLLRVPEVVGIMLTGLIWGLILWLPIRAVQGVGRAPDMQTFIFYTTVVVSVLYFIFQASR
jgi:hypothetical protein